LRVSSLLCAPGDISILRRQIQSFAVWPTLLDVESGLAVVDCLALSSGSIASCYDRIFGIVIAALTGIFDKSLVVDLIAVVAVSLPTAVFAERQNGMLQRAHAPVLEGSSCSIEAAQLPHQRRDTRAVTVCFFRCPCERELDPGGQRRMVHVLEENHPAAIVDDRDHTTSVIALGLSLGRRHHLACRCQAQRSPRAERRGAILGEEGALCKGGRGGTQPQGLGGEGWQRTPLFGAQPLARGGACFCTAGPTTAQPMPEAVHVDVDHWCREQSQRLRHQEAADDRIAQRLANF